MLHLEFSSDKKEIEVYVNGWFLCGVELKNISSECGAELKEYFEHNRV